MIKIIFILDGDSMLDDVAVAVAHFAVGRAVVVIDDEDRENEGDLIAAGSLMTTELMAFIIRHTGGIVCAAMDGADLDRLALPAMAAVNEDPKATAFTVSVDAADSGTGISAECRARTFQVLADAATRPEQLRRPGHVFPLRAAAGGLPARQGHTEAGVALARAAGVAPVAAISEVMNLDGSMTRLAQLRVFADEHGLAVISIEQMQEYGMDAGSSVSTCSLPAQRVSAGA
jgi:3,4-dihydroxy 2-butanone 4-phosphate synthase / GTP cyclohydrolase II